jgi:hypothetical protein
MWGGVVAVGKDSICFSLPQAETNLTIDGSKHGARSRLALADQ